MSICQFGMHLLCHICEYVKTKHSLSVEITDKSKTVSFIEIRSFYWMCVRFWLVFMSNMVYCWDFYVAFLESGQKNVYVYNSTWKSSSSFCSSCFQNILLSAFAHKRSNIHTFFCPLASHLKMIKYVCVLRTRIHMSNAKKEIGKKNKETKKESVRPVKET